MYTLGVTEVVVKFGKVGWAKCWSFDFYAVNLFGLVSKGVSLDSYTVDLVYVG